ncbi:phi 11 orf41 [Staphylococcus aureus]|uniref:Phi 11 orf41 n=1 Tax=Staphylococcus aureus TaxID=1280 RepID=A0A380EGD1_STAAU|nr:phi 11 orf41 [Staphylococcus aureus]
MSTLGITDLNVIEQMTLTEYNYRMYAKEYEMLTQEFERYKLAFAIRDAAATKMLGQKINLKRNMFLTMQTTYCLMKKISNGLTKVKI